MRRLAIIPARGGSKRIPRKNVKHFLGKPIIAYSIEAALMTGLFEEVMVSTDDEEIADIALHYGAKVPFMRKQENASDHATTIDVLKEVLTAYTDKGKEFEYGCCIYATAPFVSSESLTSSYHMLVEKEFDSVFPVCAFQAPILRSLNRQEDGKTTMNWPEHQKARSQDLPQAYYDVGQFYWFRCNVLNNMKGLFSENSGSIVLDELEAQDIDNPEDWKLAELKYKLKHEAGHLDSD